MTGRENPRPRSGSGLLVFLKNRGGSITPVVIFLVVMCASSAIAILLTREGGHNDLTTIQQ